MSSRLYLAVGQFEIIAPMNIASEIQTDPLPKFGGDSLEEMRRNFDGYCEQLYKY